MTIVSLDGKCKSCMYALIDPKTDQVGGCQKGQGLGMEKWKILCDMGEVECDNFVQHHQSPDSRKARYEILEGAREMADAQFDVLLHDLIKMKTRYAIRKPWINIGLNGNPFINERYVERRY